jgi:hypothetical protein
MIAERRLIKGLPDGARIYGTSGRQRRQGGQAVSARQAFLDDGTPLERPVRWLSSLVVELGGGARSPGCRQPPSVNKLHWQLVDLCGWIH